MEIKQVPGLFYIQEYLSEDEQHELLATIDQQPWITDLKRRVQHYGYRYDYKKRSVDPSMYLGTLPDWIRSLAERLHEEDFIAVVPDQAIINEYHSGQGIASHIDCIPCFDDTILSISLGSPCVMIFSHIHSKTNVPILLHPGSLVVMKEESRYEWKHGIAARKSDMVDGQKILRDRRVSITLRKIIEDA